MYALNSWICYNHVSNVRKLDQQILENCVDEAIYYAVFCIKVKWAQHILPIIIIITTRRWHRGVPFDCKQFNGTSRRTVLLLR